MNAPSLPASLQWLARPPLHLDTGLAGHVVVVVTWRVGCAMCREALHDVARATAPFVGAGVAVVALHVAVEPGEADAARVQRELAAWPFAAAIDGERAWLRQLGVRALPHVAVLDAEGALVASGVGMPFRRRLHDAVAACLQRARSDGRAAAVPWAPLPAPAPVLWPTALAAVGDEVWLASAAQHRVFALDATGRVLRAIGSGEAGQADGSAGRAEFVLPAALLPLGAQVLVADAGAHTLRAIDRGSGDVATWCGTGQRGLDRQGGGYARDQALAGPRALVEHEGGVVVAMALGRQLWQFDPGTRAAVAWCGSGERQAADGEAAAFVEPCALAQRGSTLFVADAGAGAVRALDLAHGHLATAWSGLRRPAALCAHGDELFVAEAWGPAVLRAPAGGAPQPWLGAEHGLVEPVALAVVGTQLWIADAGADAVFACELAAPSPQLVRMAIAVPPAAQASVPWATAATAVHLREHADVPLRVPVAAFAAEGALCEVDVVDEAQPRLACARNVSVRARNGVAEVLLPVGAAGAGAFRIRVRCDRATRHWVVAVAVDAAGDESATLQPRP